MVIYKGIRGGGGEALAHVLLPLPPAKKQGEILRVSRLAPRSARRVRAHGGVRWRP